MARGKVVRWVMYVAAPWVVETSMFWVFMGPLCRLEYWISMRERV